MNTIHRRSWQHPTNPKHWRAMWSLLVAGLMSLAATGCATNAASTQTATETTPMSTATNAPDTQYATVNGTRIAYRINGEGEPLLLINRFRGTLDTWDPAFIESLAQSHKVITMDYPGVGYSEGELSMDAREVAADVQRLAMHLNLENVDILGWSYGGLIAQYVAFLYPETVRKAVLVGTNPLGKNEIPLEPLFKQHALKPTYDLQDYTVLFFEPQSEASRAAAKASMERYWDSVDHSKVPSSMAGFQPYIAGMQGAAMDADDLRSQYATTEVPMLAISGDHDISFAVGNWYPLIGQAPTLQLVVIPDAGHAPHFQHPELTSAYITSFLK